MIFRALPPQPPNMLNAIWQESCFRWTVSTYSDDQMKIKNRQLIQSRQRCELLAYDKPSVPLTENGLQNFFPNRLCSTTQWHQIKTKPCHVEAQGPSLSAKVRSYVRFLYQKIDQTRISCQTKGIQMTESKRKPAFLCSTTMYDCMYLDSTGTKKEMTLYLFKMQCRWTPEEMQNWQWRRSPMNLSNRRCCLRRLRPSCPSFPLRRLCFHPELQWRFKCIEFHGIDQKTADD